MRSFTSFRITKWGEKCGDGKTMWHFVISNETLLDVSVATYYIEKSHAQVPSFN